MDRLNELKVAVTAFCGALTIFWGWFGWLCVAWVACMGIDYLTGSASAARHGQWNSKAARDGIWHKTGEIVVVFVAGATDLLLEIVVANIPSVSIPFEFKGLVCPLALVWYCLTELGSILENAIKMGANVPPWLIHILAKTKDAADKAGKEVGGEET